MGDSHPDPCPRAQVWPHELEFAYPPCTYLEPRSEHEEKVRLPGGDELVLRVFEVTPQAPQ